MTRIVECLAGTFSTVKTERIFPCSILIFENLFAKLWSYVARCEETRASQSCLCLDQSGKIGQTSREHQFTVRREARSEEKTNKQTFCSRDTESSQSLLTISSIHPKHSLAVCYHSIESMAKKRKSGKPNGKKGGKTSKGSSESSSGESTGGARLVSRKPKRRQNHSSYNDDDYTLRNSLEEGRKTTIFFVDC